MYSFYLFACMLASMFRYLYVVNISTSTHRIRKAFLFNLHGVRFH